MDFLTRFILEPFLPMAAPISPFFMTKMILSLSSSTTQSLAIPPVRLSNNAIYLIPSVVSLNSLILNTPDLPLQRHDLRVTWLNYCQGGHGERLSAGRSKIFAHSLKSIDRHIHGLELHADIHRTIRRINYQLGLSAQPNLNGFIRSKHHFSGSNGTSKRSVYVYHRFTSSSWPPIEHRLFQAVLAVPLLRSQLHPAGRLCLL